MERQLSSSSPTPATPHSWIQGCSFTSFLFTSPCLAFSEGPPHFWRQGHFRAPPPPSTRLHSLISYNHTSATVRQYQPQHHPQAVPSAGPATSSTITGAPPSHPTQPPHDNSSTRMSGAVACSRGQQQQQHHQDTAMEQVMQAAASEPQASGGLDVSSDPPLYTPFLNPIGPISRPNLPPAFSFGGSPTKSRTKTPSPIKTSVSFTHGSSSSISSLKQPGNGLLLPVNSAKLHGGSSGRRGSLDVAAHAGLQWERSSSSSSSMSAAKHVTWLDCALTAPSNSTAAAAAAGPAHDKGSNAPAWPNSDHLVSTHSAPAPAHALPAAAAGFGDLRDQGRLSSAGSHSVLPAPSATRRVSSSTSNCLVVGPLWSNSCSGGELVEEACTPLQVSTIGTDCINNLLGSLGASLFCDGLSTPPSRTAAAAAARAAAASKAAAAAAAASTAHKGLPSPGLSLPDFVEAWEGSNSSSNTASAAQPASNSSIRAAAEGAANDRRGSLGGGTSAFAGASAAAAAAAAAAGLMMGPLAPDFVSGVDSSYSGSVSHNMGHQFAAPHQMEMLCAAGGYAPHPLAHAYSTPVPHFPAAIGLGSNTVAAVAAAAALGGPWARLQRTSSVGCGPMAGGHHHHLSAAYSSGGAYGPAGMLGGGDAASGLAAAHLYGGYSTMMPLQSVPSAPLGHAAGGNPGLAAAMMQAYCQNAVGAAGSAAAEAFALQAYLSSCALSGGGNGSFTHGSGSVGSGGGYNSNSSGGGSNGSSWSGNDHHYGQHRQSNRRFGGATATSKVDPKSLLGVDPRLCVGSPEDVFAELCRRHPSLAEVLRLAPHSVKLRNVAVRADTSPPELLASKRPDGPITREELTIESGLLRHCFGLPASIGPDLVRAARHSVTRGDTPGSGLEPFFWVLQAKLNWLLKRPVFFKGQLLRGEIHQITDLQRAQSFAQVTEQRSKLGELLLVLFDMLQPEQKQQE